MSAAIPKPVGRQKEVVALPADGHTVVLGTAGSGKTTLAVHRALFLADPNTDHFGPTLLVTFNNTLVEYLSNLLRYTPQHVDVRTYHRFARGYLAKRGRMAKNSICGTDEVRMLCRQAVALAKSRGEVNPILLRSPAFLADEFRWLAQHGISSVGQYETAARLQRAGESPERTGPLSLTCTKITFAYDFSAEGTTTGMTYLTPYWRNSRQIQCLVDINTSLLTRAKTSLR